MTHVFITGCNRGIGRALVDAALAQGWTVSGSTRDGVAAPALSGHHLTFDLLNLDQVTKVIGDFPDPLDVLINSAGIIGPANGDQSTLNMDFAGFANTLAVNTLAPLAVSQAFLPHLRRSGRPRILSISSQMSAMTQAKPDRIAYRASKAALNKVMQGLATDLEPDGIPVALIDPGWVRTDMGGPAADLDADTVAEEIISFAGRITIAETAGFYLWNGEPRPF